MKTKMTLWVALMGCLLLILPAAGLAQTHQADQNQQVAPDTNNQMGNQALPSDQNQVQDQTTAQGTDLNPGLEIEKATAAFQNMISRPGKQIPTEIIKKAEAVAIFPGMTKAGLIVAGRYGKGILMVQQNGNWNGPLFLKLYGASIGAQAGVESTDMTMVFMDQRSLRNLEDGKLDFGAEASVTAGHYGEKVKTDTGAEILGYQDTAGLFAGVALSSGYIEVDNDANAAYGRTLEGQTRAYYPTIQDLMSGKAEEAQSPAAKQLVDVLKQYADQAGQGASE